MTSVLDRVRRGEGETSNGVAVASQVADLGWAGKAATRAIALFSVSASLAVFGFSKVVYPESSAVRIIVWEMLDVELGVESGNALMRALGVSELFMAAAVISTRTRTLALAALLLGITAAGSAMILDPGAFALSCGCSGDLFDMSAWTHAAWSCLMVLAIWIVWSTGSSRRVRDL